MEALQLLNDGKLDEAIASAISAVKSTPSEAGYREVLIELLCLSGDLERADKQAETIVLQHPDESLTVALLRQLIRAETSRQECWKQGRVPEFLGEPDESSQKRLSALIARRQDNLELTSSLLQEIAEQRPALSGKCDGTDFEDLLDMDDFCCGMLELLTSTGKYYWVPMERVSEMSFEPVKRPRDLLWRQCAISVTDGPDGVVYIPAIYSATDPTADGPERIGRATDWNEPVQGIFEGTGQRVFSVDGNEIGLMDIKTISIDQKS